ncbi:MAG: UDP-N-acetylmuramate dehydrogenase [Minisyncoccia bacterium]
MTILENHPLDNLNTFGIKSTARYFGIVKNENDLVEATFFIRKKKIPFFVLGGGSNLLLSDTGFNGLVLKNEMVGRDLSQVGKGIIRLGLGSGENWDEAVIFAVKNNLAGFETLSGIPGTVGATPIQNIGAYGAEIKNVISQVETFDLENMSKKIWTAEKCGFDYRDSVFKRPENKKYFVTKVFFDLKQNGQPNLEYKDVKRYFENKVIKHPTISSVRQAILEIRSLKIPNPKDLGNAGSFFKNPFIDNNFLNNLLKVYPDLPHFAMDNGKIKIPLAFVLDKICRMKGFRYGQVGLYEHQPLILVNHGEATSNDIKKFATIVADNVYNKTGLVIEWEVEEV